MTDLRHGQLPAFDPQTDDARLIAENIDAPLGEHLGQEERHG